MTLRKSSTNRDESLKSRFLRWGFNFFPAYFSTGAKITFLSSDFQEIHLEIPHTWRTRDSSGEIFKGIQYAAVDPVYPKMLRTNLGDDFVVEEKEASIRFLEPCNTGLIGQFEIPEEELDRIRDELSHHDSIIRVYKIELSGENGGTKTEVEKTLSISQTA